MADIYSEESLDAGIDRQLDAFREAQQKMANFANDLSRLKTSCDALKSQRTKLQGECAALERDKQFLESSTSRIRAEHSALEKEYAGLVDDAAALRAADNTVDASGKTARKLWLQTQKVAELEEALRTAEAEKELAVLAEREVSTALREKIARMEKEGSAGLEKEKSAGENLRHEIEVLSAQVKKTKSENQDARDALRAESKRRRGAEGEVEKLKEELQNAREEARHAKDLKSERDELKEKLARVMEELEQIKSKGSPSRALATMSPNVPPAPRTPTKSAAVASLDSPAPSNGGTPSRSLATKYEYLHRKHTQLKAQFDQMRAKYAKDIEHWKEYRSIQIARQEARRKRREATSSHAPESAGDASSSVHVPSSDPQLPDSVGDADDAPKAAEVSVSSPSTPVPRRPITPLVRTTATEHNSTTPLARANVTPLARTTATDHNVPEPQRPVTPLARIATEHNSAAHVARKTVSVPPPASQNRTPLTANKAASTPTRVAPAMAETPKLTSTSTPVNRGLATTASEPRSRQPARVTPWLGTTTRKVSGESSSSTSKKRRTSFSDDDDDDPDLSIRQSTSVGVRTPLVRDRTGESALNLRRAALQRSVTSVPPAQETTASVAPTTPETDDRKRKLDLENLSPAERAAHRKKLSRLSTAERREMYAPYKGKGRYVAPEDVQRTVADEYEIDPAKNDGVSHQFHAVVRNRDERRKMHGGDCECCRDYYEAIGPLPRFNQAPVWKDQDEDEDSYKREMELEDHQNRISRHREVWRKPPTPPDYWKIGFPSTQDVERVNEQADEMERRRQAEIRREAAHKNSKWRKKV